jgi:serine/threonine protein kinase
MIANKYDIIEKINEGSFGSVYKAINVRTNEYVAIKIEKRNSTHNFLKNEAKIYQYLSKSEGIPSLKTYWTDDTNMYLVMELLGPSLLRTIEYYKAFSLKQVIMYSIQIIERIKMLHNKELLHRDIKPNNFVFKNNKLYLIDFGLSKRYAINGIHVPEKNISKIIGSLNFVSLNVHNKIEPSRRDDLESCIYVILTMLFGKLEWFNKIDKNEIMTLKKNIIYVSDVPEFIKNILIYIRELTYDEIPNYNYIIEQFREQFREQI